MRRGSFVLGQLWMSPVTGFGLALSLLGARYHGRAAHGVLSFVARKRGPIRWYMQLLGIQAWTLGATITWRDASLMKDDRVLRHELEHVRQTMLLGPLMPVAYVGSSVWQLLRGRRLYRDNWFEQRARQAEQRPSVTA